MSKDEYNIGDVVVLQPSSMLLYDKKVCVIVGKEQLFGSVLYHFIVCGDEKNKIHFVYQDGIKERL